MSFRVLPIAAILLVWIALPAAAQIDPSLVGSCEPGRAYAFLEAENVRAQIFNGGAQFHPASQFPGYELPKGSGNNAHFTDSFLITGRVNGELRMVGSTYGPRGFWPGPIPEDGPPSDCRDHDRIYELSLAQREDAAEPEGDVMDWPVHLGAGYINENGIPGYQPLEGDLPLMRGDHYLWWINNDLGNLQQDSESNPFGIEMLNEAWGFNSPGAVGDMTFYRHTIVNRSPETIDDMYVGLWADVDLGDFSDDALGSDSTLSLAYVYTVNEADGVYGSPAPAFGFTFLEASHSRGGLPTDVGAGAGSFLTSIIAPQKGGARGEWPRTAPRYHNFMQGLWPDTGQPMTDWGQGWEDVGALTKYIFHGDPATGQGWSERNLDGRGGMNPGWDKRIMGSHGPLTMAPGDSVSFTHAYIWARGDDHLDSVTELKNIAAYLHNVKRALMSARVRQPRFVDGNPPEEPSFPFWLDEPYPNPAADRLQVEFSTSLSGNAAFVVHDILGREVLRSPVSAGTGPDRLALDVSNLPEGVYSLSFTSWSRADSKTFVVMR